MLPALYLRFETGQPRPVLRRRRRRRSDARELAFEFGGESPVETHGAMSACRAAGAPVRRATPRPRWRCSPPAASLAACTEVKSADKEHYSPATITPVKGGEEGLVSVTLTQEGADRIDIATGRGRGGARGQQGIPYAALLYEKDGSAFVYTNPSGLTTCARTSRSTAWRAIACCSARGPRSARSVVTTGAPQVHGAELEYGEY